MKKFLSLLLVAVLTLGLAACGSSDKGTTTPDAGTNSGTDAGTTEVTKIALLLPYVGDQSYFDVTYRGLSLVTEKYGDSVECTLIEMGRDAADWDTANLQAAADGYDIIISGNFQYEASMLAVAANNPDIKYINFDYSDAAANSLPNVYALTYASNEIGYLAGVVAAVKSETGVIGAIGGMENAGIQQFLTGYFQGASDVNPDIQVISSFVGDFADTAKAKEIATNMNSQGADVIWHAAGGAGNGVFEAAAENNFWAIGVDTDQYATFSEKPEIQAHILTSGLKNCDVAILNAVTAVLDGTAEFGTQRIYGYADGGVGLAENEFYQANMTEEQLATVKSFTDKVLSGETKVADSLVDANLYTEYLGKVSK